MLRQLVSSKEHSYAPRSWVPGVALAMCASSLWRIRCAIQALWLTFAFFNRTFIWSDLFDGRLGTTFSTTASSRSCPCCTGFSVHLFHFLWVWPAGTVVSWHIWRLRDPSPWGWVSSSSDGTRWLDESFHAHSVLYVFCSSGGVGRCPASRFGITRIALWLISSLSFRASEGTATSQRSSMGSRCTSSSSASAPAFPLSFDLGGCLAAGSSLEKARSRTPQRSMALLRW